MLRTGCCEDRGKQVDQALTPLLPVNAGLPARSMWGQPKSSVPNHSQAPTSLKALPNFHMPQGEGAIGPPEEASKDGWGGHVHLPGNSNKWVHGVQEEGTDAQVET